ncbi:MAG: Wzt carbohydrate-binding domain-containing protein [Rhodobacteraceae bacterium]|nr:Wzt carbohydrate-binding domain-containing protein [Paracoccaceae bacterium]
MGEDGQAAHVFYSGERVEIRLDLKASKPLTDFVVGIGIFNVDGVCAFGTNTNIEELKADRLEGEGHVSFTVDALDLVAGTYKLDAALHKLDGFPYDYHRLLYSFRVKSRTQDAGIYGRRHLPAPPLVELRRRRVVQGAGGPVNRAMTRTLKGR